MHRFGKFSGLPQKFYVPEHTLLLNHNTHLHANILLYRSKMESLETAALLSLFISLSAIFSSVTFHGLVLELFP